MKISSRFRRARVVGLTLCLVIVAFVVAGVWRSSALRRDKVADSKKQFHSRVRDGVGREVTFASAGDSADRIRASVNSVAQFIHKRSGAKLDGRTKNRMADMEERTLAGAARRIRVGELSSILADTALERLAALTDEDIAHVDENLRGFNAPDLPESYRRGRERHVQIRAGRLQAMTSAQFVDQLKALRNQTGGPLGAVFGGVARKSVADDLHKKVRVYSEAVPEHFGGAWDLVNGTEGSDGVTPLQAVLLAYSVASEDLLCDSEDTLKKDMRALQLSRGISSGGNFPSPDGYFAFGVNGYVTSSPLDIVLDERTVNRLLDRIEERGAR